MKVGIANDHAAVGFKNMLKEYLESKGHEVIDYGSTDPKAQDHYPDFALTVAQALTDGDIEKGILICGTGIGMSIAANKVPGIRAAVCNDPVSAALCVRHNNANIITLGERIVGVEMAKSILDAFFSAEFEGGRHQIRVDKIRDIENNNLV